MKEPGSQGARSREDFSGIQAGLVFFVIVMVLDWCSMKIVVM